MRRPSRPGTSGGEIPVAEATYEGVRNPEDGQEYDQHEPARPGEHQRVVLEPDSQESQESRVIVD